MVSRRLSTNSLESLRMYNVKELGVLLRHNDTPCAGIPTIKVSWCKRKNILDHVDRFKITVLNKNYKTDREDAA